MIYDTLDNHQRYHKLYHNFKIAFEYLKSIDAKNIMPGSYNIKNSDVIAIVGEYQTKEEKEAQWETHRKYIDIQYIMQGSELIGYSNLGSMYNSQKYSTINDIQFHSGEGNFVELKEGSFVIFFPEELHKPAIKIDKSEDVTKIVMKVKLKK